VSDIAIKVENLGKMYRIGESVPYRTLKESLTHALTMPFRFITGSSNGAGRRDDANDGENHIWALKDVSFDVKKGDVVGIIGGNGAGKTTLLKILSRITDPTEGSIQIRGRIGALLEVGTGFHPELTGRENIFLNAAIMGMTRAEIKRKFDDIVDFSGVENFIDTPVKRYSSGMYVRLAFSVAAYIEPEILLVDEVLAVGDAAFQKKCMGKIEDVASEGRTVIFVSHNMGVVNALCPRAILLDGGRIALDGETREVTGKYLNEGNDTRAVWTATSKETDLKKPFLFLRACVKNKEGTLTEVFESNEPITVEIEYKVLQAITSCQLGVRVYGSDGSVVFTTTDLDNDGIHSKPRNPGDYLTTFTIPERLLSPGMYGILLAAHEPNVQVFDLVEQTVHFERSTRLSSSQSD